MANSGYINTTGYQGRYLQFSWSIPEGGQNTLNNSTKINWTLKGAGTAQNGYYVSGNFKVTIDGTVVYSSASRIQLWEGTVVASGTVTLTHGADGARSFSASVEAGIYTVAVNCTGNGTWALPAIARASTITSAAAVTLGNVCAVKWTPKHKAFGYKLKFSLGGWNYTTPAIVPGTTGEYTYAGYVIPFDVANQIPKSRTGTVKVTLYTYTDSGCTSQVGASDDETFTVTVPSTLGPVAAMTLSPVNSLASPFNTMYIQGKTKVQADFSGSAGQYGATIKSLALTVGGATDSTSPYQSNLLGTSGSVEIKGTVTDTREWPTDIKKTINVIQYGAPSVIPYSGEKKIVCARCLEDGTLSTSGTHLRIKAGRKFSKVLSGGVQKNFCLLGYRYVASGGTLPAAFTPIIEKTTASDFIDLVVPGVTLAATSSYTVQIRAIDDVGDSSTLTFSIPTETITMHLKKNKRGVGIGKYAETDDLFDVGWNANFRKGINGCYMRNVRIHQTDSVKVQTMFANFDGTGGERQTIFVFGSANTVNINGTVFVNSAGNVGWTGTGNVTITAEAGGIIKVTMPGICFDLFVFISPYYFEIV